ncbi:MAG: ABC transporter ATP-binding protein [Cyanobacteria bacterium J06626_6]
MNSLRLAGITKRFGNVTANDRISLAVRSGSIHGLLGENGAGKSTLMNILSGLYQPDEGEIFLDGQRVQMNAPADAIRRGIGMIHQHFMLVPQLTVVENIILGQGSGGQGAGGAARGWIGMPLNLQAYAREIVELGKNYGLEVPPLAKVGELAVGIQQRVEILKVLYRQARILILDEPTAVLTPAEIDAFLDVLRRLAARGHTIIFISHKLDEVMAVCDEVSILRRGCVVATLQTAETNRTQLARLMINREVDVNVRLPEQAVGDVVLSVKDVWVSGALQGLSLEVRAGEILGIAGVDGNGQRELADAVAGLLPVQKGSIEIFSSASSASASSARSHKQLAYIPEDRQHQGLVLSFSTARNLILKRFAQLPFCRRWILQREAIAANATQAIQDFDIRTTSGKVKVAQLSGGNQQKVILARELAGAPDVIVAMQPTRGLDIGATAAVQQSLIAQRSRGAAILYISTELEEVMAMSDRIAVISRGRLVDVLAAKDATIEKVGALMVGSAVNTGAPL